MWGRLAASRVDLREYEGKSCGSKGNYRLCTVFAAKASFYHGAGGWILAVCCSILLLYADLEPMVYWIRYCTMALY